MIVLHAHPNNGLPCEMCFLACSEKSSFKLLSVFAFLQLILEQLALILS